MRADVIRAPRDDVASVGAEVASDQRDAHGATESVAIPRATRQRTPRNKMLRKKY
jgi:hypothetical protein